MTTITADLNKGHDATERVLCGVCYREIEPSEVYITVWVNTGAVDVCKDCVEGAYLLIKKGLEVTSGSKD